MICVADPRFPNRPAGNDSYGQFWHQYLRQHADRRTRIAHYAGTSLAIGAVALFAMTANWAWLIAATLAGVLLGSAISRAQDGAAAHA